MGTLVFELVEYKLTKACDAPAKICPQNCHFHRLTRNLHDHEHNPMENILHLELDTESQYIDI